MATIDRPLAREVKMAAPLAGARALSHLPRPFLLHAGTSDPRARWSFFGADPFVVFEAGDYDQGAALWRRLSAGGETHAAHEPPFQGGVVGAWAYDFGRRLERWPTLAKDDVGLPDVTLGFYDVIGAFDHATGATRVFSSGLPLEGPHRRRRAEQRLDHFTRLIEGAKRAPLQLPARLERPVHLSSTFTPDGYRR